ncbi:hypothetical protein AIOL_004066 [Candidatus Rhodobacter oscarellae]|uniref:Transmembrane anti-sigma factor n=1 Tax=Candidatus Rhodobacter oscarellae TaxID=1675527 RepID=A0A0J9E8J4_9RHOB|nr:hypothetical protein [Candidatus Rhodobacter lobularis]KMW59085.1 hypothetical protein AIOL_004066 [Candidatus Rhodobacter lobularis]
MTDDRIAITDEELTAFLDGQADGALSARIAAALSSDAELARRLAALDAPVSALASLTPEALGAPAPPAWLAEPPAPARRFALLPLGVALAAGLAIGVLVGPALLATEPTAAPEPGWIGAVAAYQALYGPETVANGAQNSATTQAVLARFDDEFSLELAAITQIEGFELKRAQPLSFKGRPLLQVVFADEGGAPIALCALRVAKPDRSAVTEVAAGLAATHWIKDGVGFVVIGGQETAVTGAMAAQVMAKL